MGGVSTPGGRLPPPLSTTFITHFYLRGPITLSTRTPRRLNPLKQGGNSLYNRTPFLVQGDETGTDLGEYLLQDPLQWQSSTVVSEFLFTGGLDP